MPMEDDDPKAGIPVQPEDPKAGPPLHPSTVQRVRAARLGLSLDWWAVIIAVALAGLVLTGLLPKVGW